MSSIGSKFSDIRKMRFEPLTAAVVKVQKMTTVGNTIVALGADGVIYTTGVGARYHYSGGHDGRLSRVLDGCVKLRCLSAEAVRQHKADTKAWADKQNAEYLAKSITENAAKLGLKLTAAQTAKLAVLTANAPHEGPARASCAGPLDAVVGPQTNGGNDGNLG